MQIAKLKREEFLTWIGTKKISRSVPLKKMVDLSKGEVALVFEEKAYDATQGVLLIVKDEQELLDFYAFVSTYVSTYVPFSAFFRTLTIADFESPRVMRVETSGGLKRMLVGAIICGAISNGPSKDLARISLVECLASESFVLAKGILDGLAVSPDRIFSRWQYCSSILGGDRSSQKSSNSMPFWEAIFAAVGLRSQKGFDSNAEAVVAAVKFLLSMAGRGLDEIWSVILKVNPAIAKVRPDMSGPREVRARAFTSVVASETLPDQGVMGDFIVGFLGSLLAGGAFEYAKLISDFKPIYPTSALWFGFISASMDESDVLSAGGSLGRHILRGFRDSGELLDVPQCDIGFGELALFARSGDRLDMVRGRSNDCFEVELFPSFVCSFSRGPVNSTAKSPIPSGISRDSLAEARRLLSRLQRVLIEDSPADRDQDLFDPPSSRKKSRYEKPR